MCLVADQLKRTEASFSLSPSSFTQHNIIMTTTPRLSGNHSLMNRPAYSSRQRHLLLRPQQTNASSFFSSSMGYHANLSRHLPDDQEPIMTPSPLRRQNAFLQEDRSNMSNDKTNFSIPSPTSPHDDLSHSNVSSPTSSQLENEDPKCRICFGESEEGGAAFIVPCKCNGSMYVVLSLLSLEQGMKRISSNMFFLLLLL